MRVKVPLPGQSVRGSQTGVAIMAALDLLGRRWALQIIWELHERPLGFTDLQRACKGITATVLSTRLKELQVARILRKQGDRLIELSPIGEDLYLSIGSLKNWSRLWAQELNQSVDSTSYPNLASDLEIELKTTK